MGATEENGNGKVTIAILGYRVDCMDKKLDGIEEKLDRFLSKQNEQGNQLTSHAELIKTNCEEIKTLRSSSRNWDVITVISAAIATVLGLVGIKQ